MIRTSTSSAKCTCLGRLAFFAGGKEVRSDEKKGVLGGVGSGGKTGSEGVIQGASTEMI